MLPLHLSLVLGGRSPAGRSLARWRRAERGLTLVELLIAVALLGFILLGIAPLFIASVKSNYSANEYTSANTLARDKLEELENLGVNSPALYQGTYGNDLPAVLPDPGTGKLPLAGTPAVPNPFQRSWTVTNMQLPQTTAVPPPVGGVPTPFYPTPVTGNSLYDYKQVDVTVVTDPAHLGLGQRRTMVTGFIQNPNPQNTPVATAAPTAVPPTPTP